MLKQSYNIRYVGTKTEGETAFSPATGITWYPGSEHPIPSSIALRMLQHPDVFQDVDNPKKTPQALAAEEATAKAAMPTVGAFNLMDLLPPGAKITLPDGTHIEIPGGTQAQHLAAAAGTDAVVRTAGTVGAESALGDPNAIDPTSLNYADPRAQRFANFTDPAAGAAGAFADETVKETVVPAGNVDAASISLAPGSTVAAAPPGATSSDTTAATARVSRTASAKKGA